MTAILTPPAPPFAPSPSLASVTAGTVVPQADFHSPRYLRNDFRRMEHLATLGLNVRGKSVLEVGAGIGDLTTFFLDRGCRVVSTDGRLENLAMLRERYRGDAAVEVAHLDLDPPPAHTLPPLCGREFEIVFCYGLLYHVSDPSAALDMLAACCGKNGVLLLETIVSFGDGQAINPYVEDVALAGAAVSGLGCRPTRPWVFSQLQRRFGHVYMPMTQPNHAEFPVDWSPAGAAAQQCAARSVFIASRKAICNPQLVSDVVMSQHRC